MGACLYPADVLSGDHVVLHHLVPFIIYTVALQTVKSVLRGHIDDLLALQAMVQIHELVLSCKILAVLLPVIQRA